MNHAAPLPPLPRALNPLEQAAHLITVAQTEPGHRPALYSRAAPLIELVARQRIWRRNIADQHLRDDLVQLVHIAVWRHIHNKTAPTSPVLLHLLIGSSISNGIRGDTRAKRRLGALTIDAPAMDDAEADHNGRTHRAG